MTSDFGPAGPSPHSGRPLHSVDGEFNHRQQNEIHMRVDSGALRTRRTGIVADPQRLSLRRYAACRYGEAKS
jgi:hypothetical protein